MKNYPFEVDFGYGPKASYVAEFNLELNDEEVAYIKKFLEVNGDCDYGYMEFENSRLFNKINDAANDAVLKEINKHSRKKIAFSDVDWMGLSFDFIWPEELLGE